MITPTPLIDVVIPAYNAGAFIVDTLKSVAKQDAVINTIFVVNDGSTDNTELKVVQFKESYPSINVVLLNQDNAGLSAARNTGIQHSHADFIALLDADDLWKPQKLSSQIEIFTKSQNPKLGVVYCGYELIDEHSQPLPYSKKAVISPQLRGSVYQSLLRGNFISGSGSSVLIKRSAFHQIGLFDTTLPACEDWDMWLRLSQEYDFDYVAQDLVLIRVHQNNMQKDSLRMISAEMRLLNKFIERGEQNSFLLWKVRTYIVNKSINASAIPGFNLCSPKLHSLLVGWRMFISKALLLPLKLLAQSYIQLRNQKK